MNRDLRGFADYFGLATALGDGPGPARLVRRGLDLAAG